MKHTMRIITLLLLTMVGAGQMWAETDEPSNIKRGTITGGSIAFYADEACTSNFEGDVAANATVYVKATPEPGNTAIGVTFTAKKGISSDAMQAPRRSAEGPGIAADITVSAVTGKPGIYSFTMPDGENTNVTINATFATPAQQQVSYVDENYETHEVDAYVLDETMSVLPAGFYVVPNDLTVDHNIESNSGKGSSVTIIIADGKTLTVNGSFGMPCDLSFFGQGNATGKLTINATGNGISIGGSVTVAHLDVDIVSKNSNGIGCSNGVTIIGCANGNNTVKVHSANTCISGGQKSVTIKYCDVDVVCEGSMIAIDCLASVTIEGVATGDKVNTVNVRSAGDCIGTSNNPVTISYCNVEMTGTTQTDNVYDACGSSGITTSGGVVITGRTDVTNTLKVRCGGNTTSICYGISGGNNPVTISHYNVDIVNEKGDGISTAYDVTITGGQVEITGGTNGKGIYSAIGNITYTWVSTTDYIKASSYYLNSSKAVVFADGQRFVAYNMANANDISATAIASGTVDDVTLLAGKTLRPLDGNYVSVDSDDFTFSGTTSTTSPFTITTGEGENTTTTHYYIYKENNTATLSYTGNDFVQVTGLPEGTTLAAVTNEPMQRTFTMPATDVALTATSVTGLTATSATYDGTALTPEIKQGDDVFDAANYTIAYKLGNDDVTADDVKDANTYTCTLTGVGQYVGTTTVPLTIDKANYHEPEDIQNITKYVPSDKSGSYTFALPALPDGAAYSFTKTDKGGIIASHAYDAEHNTLTVATNSGTTSGTAATIAVAATGATNYNDYSFKVNVTVSEYTTAYGWPEQTNIWLDADNELVWAEGGNTLNTALITVKKGSTTITDYTVKMGDTELTAGEKLLTLEPGVYRINITGDDGKLDDWVDFKVIKLVENDAKLTMDIPLSYVLPGVVTEPNTTVYYDGNNVTSAEDTKLWYRHEIGENYTSHLNDELYDNDTYSTRQTNHVDALSGNAFTIGTGNNTDMRISNVNGSASLDGVSRIDTKCGQVILHREGEEIKQKLDLNDVPVSSGVDGGYVYYVGIDCPDFYLKEGKVYYKDETGEHLANQTNDYNEVVTYAITDGKDIFYAGGAEIFQYGNFVSFGENRFNLDDTPGVLTCASRKTIGWECHCQKDANGDCVSCFSQNGDILTVCGETIHLGQYILVGPNFVVLGDKYLYDFMPPSEGHVGPDSRKINAVFDADSHILTVAGYEINVGNKPICWVDDVACTAQVYYPTMNYDVFLPCAYVKYRTGDCCYSVARKDYVTIPYSSALSIQCDSQYKVGDDINITFTVSGCEDEYGNTDGKGSTGDVIVYLNNEYKSTLCQAPYEYNPGDLAEGTYVLRVKQHGDETHRGAETTATFTVVRTDPVLTLTGSQNTAGKPFESGANIEYDPENPIVVNAVNDKTVSDTYWRWQISNTSDAGVVKIDHTVNKSGQNNKNSEDIYLNTVGLGTVKLWAGFSGNDLYNPAKEAITFTVVPKNVTSPIIELADQSTIYYDGTAKKPAVNVYYAEGKEIPADQYDVTYANNTNGSTEDAKAKIIVKSKTGALYTIDAEKEFEIQETTLFAANSTNLWATFCSQNEYEVPEGCTAYTISGINGSTVMLSDALTSIPAYTPVLIQRSANVTVPVTAIYKAAGAAPASGYDAQTGLAAIPGTAFTFYGNCLRSDVSADDFKGYYNEGQTYLLFDGKFILADENGGLGAHKCLLVLNGTNNAPVLSISEEITSLTPIPSPKGEGREYFYTLDGRKLDGKPTKKGLYIHNGRKVVIK